MKRIYIPMPDAGARRALLQHLLAGQPARLGRADLERIVAATDSYSSSDLAALCREAAIIPLRCAQLLPAVAIASLPFRYEGFDRSADRPTCNAVPHMTLVRGPCPVSNVLARCCQDAFPSMHAYMQDSP